MNKLFAATFIGISMLASQAHAGWFGGGKADMERISEAIRQNAVQMKLDELDHAAGKGEAGYNAVTAHVQANPPATKEDRASYLLFLLKKSQFMASGGKPATQSDPRYFLLYGAALSYEINLKPDPRQPYDTALMALAAGQTLVGQDAARCNGAVQPNVASMLTSANEVMTNLLPQISAKKKSYALELYDGIISRNTGRAPATYACTSTPMDDTTARFQMRTVAEQVRKKLQ